MEQMRTGLLTQPAGSGLHQLVRRPCCEPLCLCSLETPCPVSRVQNDTWSLSFAQLTLLCSVAASTELPGGSCLLAQGTRRRPVELQPAFCPRGGLTTEVGFLQQLPDAKYGTERVLLYHLV